MNEGHPLVRLRRMLGRIRRALRRDPDRFLKRTRGIVHVGASIGQEREHYAELGLRVLWIEPIPEVFRALTQNIAAWPQQRAIEALVTDRDDAEVPLHVASNNGMSSSILDLKLHRDIWPTIEYTHTLNLRSVTLATLFQREAIDPALYDGLVIDTQGSELMVLQGAAPLLRHFRMIQAEAADFELYAGCCRLHELDAFLQGHGFRRVATDAFAKRKEGGSVYDVTYLRR